MLLCTCLDGATLTVAKQSKQHNREDRKDKSSAH